jgi:MinD superfamily P-loop ATPase
VSYADCDVEEPNGHIFLKPALDRSEEVHAPVPIVNVSACTACGECSRICRFSAIASLGEAPPLTFPELCKGCGGCFLVCRDNALTEGIRTVGVMEKGAAAYRGIGKALDFIHGRLRVGEAQAPPLIRRIKEELSRFEACQEIGTQDLEGVTILDAPPGTSCPVIETVRESDFVLLVTEPTPFGLNDLTLAVKMVRALDVSFAAAINRSDAGNDDVARYCEEEGIHVLLEMQDDRRIAEAYSRGEAVLNALPEYGEIFCRLGSDILETAA